MVDRRRRGADAGARGGRRSRAASAGAGTQAGDADPGLAARSAPRSSGGPARSWSRPSRWRWSACSRCPATRPTTTTATTCPTTCPANVGYAAADRHFSPARMNPELLMIESDHDLRNSADFLVIDKIAKAHLPGARHRAGAGDHPAAGQRRSSTPRSRSRSACRAPRQTDEPEVQPGP